MKILEYELRFTAPAFLGNAEQVGQWRTPPIKALLRQFWRMAYAADHAFVVDTETMRNAEGKLFGVAADAKGASRKSEVRIRLSHWHVGSLKTWLPLATVPHREVPVAVGSDLYLGYGPITLTKGAKAPSLKANAAIQADETASVRIAIPEGAETSQFYRALALMHLYGALGLPLGRN